MQNYRELIVKYIKEAKPNSLEDLKDIDYLCNIEKHERDDSDIILLTEYLLKTDLFKSFKDIKIEEQTFINLLTTICFESNLIMYPKNNSAIYNLGDQAAFFYIILKGKVSVSKPLEEKKQITQFEYLDHLDKLYSQKIKHNILFEKTIQANNHILYINKFKEEQAEIRDLIKREETQETKYNFSLFFMKKVSEICSFGNFGEKALEGKNKKRDETIMTESENTVLLAIDEQFFKDKIHKELYNFRLREAKFLNENFFLQNISRINFLNKIFDFFKFQELKKGDVITFGKENRNNISNLNNYNNNSIEGKNIFDNKGNQNEISNQNENKEENKNYIYFLREGILDLSINLSLIELINLIKNLVYKRECFIKDFFHDIDLDMKNQPEKYLDEFKKKKLLNLFRLSIYDCIGIEQLYYKNSNLYQVTVASETARLYRLSLDDLKQIFKINKISFGCFNNYAKKKMQNLLKRLISSKYMIINKIDSSEDYSQEARFSCEKTKSNNANGNSYLNKLQNKLFKINQNLFIKSEINATNNINSGNNNNNNFYNKDKNINRARTSVTTKPSILENENVKCNKNNQVYLETINDTNSLLNIKSKKNKNRILTTKEKRINHQLKKYKIIENEEDLNILYKNHKSPKEFSKLNDKLFTMLNSSSKYKIPNIEKIIEEEVEKMNKPLSELKREELNIKRMLKCESTNLNSKDKSLNITSNNNNNQLNFNSANNINKYRKFCSSANLNTKRKDLSNTINCSKKIVCTQNLIKKLTNNSAINDEYNIDLEKEFFDSPRKSDKNNNFNLSRDNLIFNTNINTNYNNNSEFNFNEIYGSPLLSPTFSKNSNKNFKNIENMLKNEHLNIVVSKTKNLNHFNRNKKFDFGFKYDYNNFINTNSFSNFYVGDPKNVLESPMNIFNVSNKSITNSFNYINFSSKNNTKKYTLRRVADNYDSSQKIISHYDVKKDSDYLYIKDCNDKIINELNKENKDLEKNQNNNNEDKEKISNAADHNIDIDRENNQNLNNFDKSKINNNKDPNNDTNIVISKQIKIMENKNTETEDKNTNTDILNFNKENEVIIEGNNSKNNKQIIETYLNDNAQGCVNNFDQIKNSQKEKPEKLFNTARKESSKDFNKLKLIRPVSVINANKRNNYNTTVNNTTNQSNLDNANELNLNSNQNQFLLNKQNAQEDKLPSNYQTLINEINTTDMNKNFDSDALKIFNKNNALKIEKESNTNKDITNKIVNLKNNEFNSEKKNIIKKELNKNKIVVNSFFHYKNKINNNSQNFPSRNNKNNGVNFSNSIINNKVTTNTYNFNSNNLSGNLNNNLTASSNQVKIIDINSPIYNAKNNVYEDFDYANGRHLNSQLKNNLDYKKMDELNSKRIGLKTVKNRIPFYQNISQNNFNEKFKVINIAHNTSKNSLKGNSVILNNGK